MDHGTLLGFADPLREALAADEHGCKVLLLDPHPTVEVVAAYIAAQLAEPVRALGGDIARVEVSETPANSATWDRW